MVLLVKKEDLYMNGLEEKLLKKLNFWNLDNLFAKRKDILLVINCLIIDITNLNIWISNLFFNQCL